MERLANIGQFSRDELKLYTRGALIIRQLLARLYTPQHLANYLCTTSKQGAHFVPIMTSFAAGVRHEVLFAILKIFLAFLV